MSTLHLLTLLLFFNGAAASDQNKTNALGLSGTGLHMHLPSIITHLAAELRLTCKSCINMEFLPAYAKQLFNGWNLTDFGEFSTMPQCDNATSKHCEPGEICAKKTSK
jgi:hypothetical protein